MIHSVSTRPVSLRLTNSLSNRLKRSIHWKKARPPFIAAASPSMTLPPWACSQLHQLGCSSPLSNLVNTMSFVQNYTDIDDKILNKASSRYLNGRGQTIKAAKLTWQGSIFLTDRMPRLHVAFRRFRH